jgi:hypothetical protein
VVAKGMVCLAVVGVLQLTLSRTTKAATAILILNLTVVTDRGYGRCGESPPSLG